LGAPWKSLGSGRVELQAAFQKFEERLDGRISALDQKLGNRFSEFQETIAQGLAASRTAVNEQLNNALEESRSSRAELKEAFGQFETKVEQRLTSLDGSMTARFEALQGALSARLQESAQALLTHLGQANTEAAAGRAEAARTLTASARSLQGCCARSQRRLPNPVRRQ
jgi:hypothetical protein